MYPDFSGLVFFAAVGIVAIIAAFAAALAWVVVGICALFGFAPTWLLVVPWVAGLCGTIIPTIGLWRHLK